MCRIYLLGYAHNGCLRVTSQWLPRALVYRMQFRAEITVDHQKVTRDCLQPLHHFRPVRVMKITHLVSCIKGLIASPNANSLKTDRAALPRSRNRQCIIYTTSTKSTKAFFFQKINLQYGKFVFRYR